MQSTRLNSTALLFAFLVGLALAGFFVGCLFTASETACLKFIDSGVALLFLFNAANNLRAALVALTQELEILRGTTSFLSCIGPITAKPNNRSL